MSKILKRLKDEFLGMSKSWKAIILSVVIMLLFLLILLPLAGCVTPAKSYVEANYSFLSLAIPDLIRYIEKDENLSAIDREARIKAANTILDLNKRAFENILEGELHGK